MSWSILFVGTAEKITAALDAQSNQLTGPSKTEFDAALPHLKGLVSQNFNPNSVPTLRLSASGHGYSRDNQDIERQLTVSLELIYGVLE